jgi:hypothetical protein
MNLRERDQQLYDWVIKNDEYLYGHGFTRVAAARLAGVQLNVEVPVARMRRIVLEMGGMGYLGLWCAPGESRAALSTREIYARCEWRQMTDWVEGRRTELTGIAPIALARKLSWGMSFGVSLHAANECLSALGMKGRVEKEPSVT